MLGCILGLTRGMCTMLLSGNSSPSDGVNQESRLCEPREECWEQGGVQVGR